MRIPERQRLLSDEATDAFDHKWLFATQIDHFKALTAFTPEEPFDLLDVGGGTGRFAQALRQQFPRCSVTILDVSAKSVQKAATKGIQGIVGSILDPPPALASKRYDVVAFNMILHHLVGDSDRFTEANQKHALTVAAGLLKRNGRIVVNEYCYSGLVGDDSSGRLIYEITRSKVLAGVVRAVGRVCPPLAANTVGVGVRFRPLPSWAKLGAEAGLCLDRTIDGPPDPPSLIRRTALLIRAVNRSSLAFVLRS